MKTSSKTRSAKKNQEESPQPPHYVLRLYVTGTTRRSVQAIANIRKICEAHLKGRYELEVVDIYQQPVLAAGEQIIAAPTLIRKLPLPLRRFIGDMTNTDRIILGLDLVSTGGPSSEPERAGEP